MFRSASQIDSERTASSLRRIKANWERTADNWFTGSVDSIDRRIALCERLIHQASQATARLLDRPESAHYMKLANDLQADHEALTQMRRDLLTAASDRDPDLYKFANEKPCGVTFFGRPLADMNPDDANHVRSYLAELDDCPECQNYQESGRLRGKWLDQKLRKNEGAWDAAIDGIYPEEGSLEWERGHYQTPEQYRAEQARREDWEDY